MATVAKDDLLTITEAAQALGVSRPTVAGLIARGELSGFKSTIDRRARFVRVKDVDSLRRRAFVILGSSEGNKAATSSAA